MVEFDSLTYNLLSLFEQVTPTEYQDGITWYAEAKRILDGYAVAFGAEPDQVYALCAALSPQTEWTRNLAIVREYLEFRRIPGIPAARHRMAERIMAGEPVNQVTKGKKVLAFHDGIRTSGTGSLPCIDSHAINAAILSKTPERVRKAIWSSARLYSAFAEAYREAAERCGIPVQQFQAIIWTAWRSRLQYNDFSQPRLSLEIE